MYVMNIESKRTIKDGGRIKIMDDAQRNIQKVLQQLMSRNLGNREWKRCSYRNAI
jgi:hypothetical protein